MSHKCYQVLALKLSCEFIQIFTFPSIRYQLEKQTVYLILGSVLVIVYPKIEENKTRKDILLKHYFGPVLLCLSKYCVYEAECAIFQDFHYGVCEISECPKLFMLGLNYPTKTFIIVAIYEPKDRIDS